MAMVAELTLESGPGRGEAESTVVDLE